MLVVCRFAFGEEVNVFPGQMLFHPHVMYLLADIGIPYGLCMGHCMCNVPIEMFKVSSHGRLDCGR